MGYRHSKAEILDAAVAVAADRGLAGLTFATVGERLGISDRTVVYYFASKPALVTAVVHALGADLQVLLDEAFGSGPLGPDELIERAWPVLATESGDRVFRLFFEAIGLASSGQAPYDALAPALLGGWVEWLTGRLRGSDPEGLRAAALDVVSRIDGYLLVRQVLGAEAADAAFRAGRSGGVR